MKGCPSAFVICQPAVCVARHGRPRAMVALMLPLPVHSVHADRAQERWRSESGRRRAWRRSGWALDVAPVQRMRFLGSTSMTV